jgi:hypothetical protein
MADLNDINSALQTKIVGQDTSGSETNTVNATTLGLQVDVQASVLPTGAATSALQTSLNTLTGAVTETAPASDTASSGLNGRLQRIAQRLTSLIALIPTAVGTAFFTRISDGTDTAKVTTNSDLSVSDGLRNGGVYGSLTLTTGGTTYEAKVGGSRLAQRKLLTITANDDMYWGYDSSVSTSTGTPLFKNQQITFSVDPDSTFQIWLVASGSSKTARITEAP